LHFGQGHDWHDIAEFDWSSETDLRIFFAWCRVRELAPLTARRADQARCAMDGDVDEEHGHRALRVVGKVGKLVLVPLPPATQADRGVGGAAAMLDALSCRIAYVQANLRPALPPTHDAGGGYLVCTVPSVGSLRIASVACCHAGSPVLRADCR
jgi:hypothetical protein